MNRTLKAALAAMALASALVPCRSRAADVTVTASRKYVDAKTALSPVTNRGEVVGYVLGTQTNIVLATTNGSSRADASLITDGTNTIDAAGNVYTNSVLSGKVASTNDVQLTPVYSQTPTSYGWVCAPSTYNGHPIEIVADPNSENQYVPYANGEDIGVSTPLASGENTITWQASVDWIDMENDLTATRTATYPIIGYTLGTQTNIVLLSTNELADAISRTMNRQDVCRIVTNMVPVLSEWIINPPTHNGLPITIEDGAPYAGGAQIGDAIGGYDSTYLEWGGEEGPAWAGEPDLLVATRNVMYKNELGLAITNDITLLPVYGGIGNSIVGYTLGTQTNIVLASTNLVAAVADARPTKAEIDAGWWSEWTFEFYVDDEWVGVDDPRVQEDVASVSLDYDDSDGWQMTLNMVGGTVIPLSPSADTHDENATQLGFSILGGDDVIRATRHRVAAPVPTKTSDLTNDSGFLTQHQQLTPVYSQTPTFSEWTVAPSPSGYVSIIWMPDSGIWRIEGDEIGDMEVSSADGENATELLFGGYTATRTRTDIVGYTLGNQATKPIQPQLATNQLDAVNSGATAAKVAAWDGYAAQIAGNVATNALASHTYDFSTNVGLYTGVRDLILALGGSVTNFPAINGGN